MKENKKLFDEIFKEVSLESIENESGGKLTNEQCAMQWLACLQDSAWPCGPSNSCELFERLCGGR